MKRYRNVLALLTISILAVFYLISFRNDNFIDEYANLATNAEIYVPNTTVREKYKAFELTMVTLYIPIENFQKGKRGTIFTNSKYLKWMETFGWLTNKVVAFVEGDEYYTYFKNIRSKHPVDRTVLIKINRTDLKSFKDYDKVHAIYSSPTYPKHHPNTVNANYSLTMNAKYDALQMAMDLGHVDTKYLAWMDIGYFRKLQKPNKRPKNYAFTLHVPLHFDEKKIGFTQVGSRDYFKKLSPWDYIRDNHVWVAGGFIIGTKPIIKKFIKSYKVTFETLLEMFMSNTDQQIIGAMYSPQMIKNQEVDIKTYTCSDGQFGLHGSDDQYFCLGFTCMEAAKLRIMNSSYA